MAADASRAARLIALRSQIGVAMATIHGVSGDGSQAVLTETERQLLGAWADLSLVQALIHEWLSEIDDD